MLDHITLRVRDIEKSKSFYDELLKTIDYKIVLRNNDEPFRGYGPNVDPLFEIVQEDENHPANSHVHIAFKVKKLLRIFTKTPLHWVEKIVSLQDPSPTLRKNLLCSLYIRFRLK